jgi:GntR family transcriptional repressor for pyruvate dehydrogenase complex
MHRALGPVVRQSLSNELADRVQELIRTGDFRPGDRLPSIADMARRFGVGHPPLREALKKLETLGIVSIRHGSGVYVGRNNDSLLISNPAFSGSISKKLLIDLIDARESIELAAVRLAAEHATPENFRQMKLLLQQAAGSFEDDVALNAINMSFHNEIATASGNVVLSQLLSALISIFQDEQRVILAIYGFREKDLAEHVSIFEALLARDAELAEQRMRHHVSEVREVLLQWTPAPTAGE